MKNHFYFLLWMVLLPGFIGYGQGKDFGTRVPYTQNASSAAEGIMSEMLVKSLGQPVNPYGKTHIKGSPYFDDNFSKGPVLFRGNIVDTLYLRYNAYQDEIQTSTGNKGEEPFQAILKNSDISCILDHKSVEYLGFYNEQGERLQGYLFRLAEGKRYTLYSRRSKSLRQGKISSNSLARSVAPRLIDNVEYYLSSGDVKPLRQLPERKKKFLKLFDEKQRPAIRNLIEENQFDLDNENDMLQLVALLNGE